MLRKLLNKQAKHSLTRNFVQHLKKGWLIEWLIALKVTEPGNFQQPLSCKLKQLLKAATISSSLGAE